jgi:alpha-beta hydrolase superfamily lysophospholipase
MDGLFLSFSWIERIASNWAALTIALTCTGLVIWCCLVIDKYVRISLNIFTDTPPPLSMGPLDFERVSGQEVRLRAFDGTSLRGMWVRGGQSKGVIIFCHEFGSDMHSCARYTKPLMQAGFDIFTFDFRGHGESSCPPQYRPLQWASDKETGDVMGAIAHVHQELTQRGEPARIGLFGISRGGCAAILAAATDSSVEAVLADGAFSTDSVCISLMKRWAKIFARVRVAYENHPEGFWRLLYRLMRCRAQRRMGCRYPSVRLAMNKMAPRPIMLIHGAQDSYVPAQQTQLLYEEAPSPKYVWIVPRAKHNQSVVIVPDEYAQRTVAFFEKHLAGTDVDEVYIRGRTSPAPAEAADSKVPTQNPQQVQNGT